MRPSQKSGRSRGKGNRNNNNNKNMGHSPNRVYESAGPEGKVRGTPQQIIDKYLALARDAQLSGDRVTAENFLQHAEHYSRILVAAAEAAAERQSQHQGNQPQPNADGQNTGAPNTGAQNTGAQNAGAQAQGADVVQAQLASPAAEGESSDVPPEPRAEKPRRRRAPRPVADEQPSDDALAAVDVANGGTSDIVETPESTSAAPKPRTRRPRPKAAKPADSDAPASDASDTPPAAAE